MSSQNAASEAADRSRPELATFPLHAIRPGDPPTCGCGADGCANIGKHPAFPYAQLEAGEQLGAGPSGGYGIATGRRSGVFVVDLDVRPEQGKDGIAAFAALGNTPPTTIVATPSGGLHLYFKLPIDAATGEPMRVKTSGGELGPGIDVRGEGGYVVGPESPHRNGGTYEVIQDMPIAEPPAWLVDLLTTAREVPPAGPSPRRELAIEGAELARRIGLAVEYLHNAPPAVENEGGSLTMLNVCMYLVVRLELPLDTATGLLTEPGGYNDRCQPPWSMAQIDHKLRSAANSERAARPEEHGPAPEWFGPLVDRLVACTPSYVANDTAPVAPLAAAKKEHVYTYAPGARTMGASEKHSFSATQADLLTHEQWDGVLGYDEFRGRIVARNPPVKLDAETSAGLSDTDVTRIRGWFEFQKKLVSKDSLYDAIDAVAKQRPFHPVRDYLRGLPAPTDDDRAALASFAATALGNAGKIEADMIRKTLVGAVRRILSPGCKVDTVLVLVGPQGAKKSSLLAALFGDDFFKDQLPDIASKDASAELRTAWCVELAELASIRKSDRDTLKSFLSRRVDTYRPPYGRCEISSPRHCVFIGTTNAPTFLEDPTGGRRFWPLKVSGPIDLDWVKAHRDGLWAAAYELAKDATYPHWFDDFAGELDEVRAQFEEQDPWHVAVAEHIAGREWVQRENVAREALGLDIAKASKADILRVTDVLQRLGCESKPHGPTRARHWKVPAKLAAAVPSSAELKRRQIQATRDAVVGGLASLAS